MSAGPQSAPSLRVVVGVDSSEPSRQALRWAHFLAVSTASTVEAVMAWTRHTEWGVMSAGMGGIAPTADPEADAKKVLAATVREVFGEDPPAAMSLTVRKGNPAEVLIEASHSALLLVVGSRGHGGFAGLLLGSVSAACTAHATCPVVVLHGDTPPPRLLDPDGISSLR